ncbi:MAG TPA: ATP-binding protein, partial [Levilinea sp.]|nr:ATP-binding protein [Levilinea sp.]
VMVQLAFSPGWLTIVIQDKGIGLTREYARQTGFGIRNMRARIQQLDGEMTITSIPGEGVSVQARIPLTDLQNGVPNEIRTAHYPLDRR